MNNSKSYSFQKAKFVKSAIDPKDYPVLRTPSGEIMPEIAVAGRSNVGKSSLLNNLFQNKTLVKVSATPGKTQLINFFIADDKLALVDLPGYGYAKVPFALRQEWGPMIQRYLETRESLKVILVLFDIRRLPNEEDKSLVDWIQYYNKDLVLVLTKVDKVTSNERKSNAQKILQLFSLEHKEPIFYSTKQDLGRRELVSQLNTIIG